jgi:hypothetical protein
MSFLIDCFRVLSSAERDTLNIKKICLKGLIGKELKRLR